MQSFVLAFLFVLGGSPLFGAGMQGTPEGETGVLQVFLVRHAEKDSSERRDPGLTEAGEARARALAHTLGSSGVTHLFSTDYRRTRSTLAPLAQAKGLALVVYDPRNPKDIVNRLAALPAGSVAVVAGHSNTTPQLFQTLGGARPAGLTKRGFLPEHAFDRLFSVTLFTGSGDMKFVAGFEQRYGAPPRVVDLEMDDYLGAPLPGDRIELFAPGLVSTGQAERDLALSPNGHTLLTTLNQRGAPTLILYERPDGALWMPPRIAPFSGTYPDLEPTFDPRDHSLWFCSKRPLPGETEVGDWNIWRVEKGEKGWGQPAPVKGLNGPGDEFYPSISNSGEVVFTATREGGEGGEDLWLATEEWGKWTIRSAGPSVNSAGPEFNSCWRPDGQALIFSSVREGDQGGGDLYISERDGAGQWSQARALTKLNSPALDYCPSFSPDGKQFWFTSRRRMGSEPTHNLEELRKRLVSPGNGQDDIYWVSSKGIE